MNTTHDEIPEVEVGLFRAQEILDRMESLPNPIVQLPSMAAHVMAITAVEHAKAAQVSALVAVLANPSPLELDATERAAVMSKARDLLGLPIGTPND